MSHRNEMPTYTLGFNAYMQDSAACLLADGEVLRAIEEERLTRQKHTGRFPQAAIRWCLRDAGIDIDALSAVAFNMRPVQGVITRARQVLGGLPESLSALTAPTPARAEGRLRAWARMATAHRRFKRDIGRGRYGWHWVPHHDAHALSAFLPSPFEEAAILVVDGSGELASLTAYRGRGTTIERLWDVPFPHSLGYAYSALTQYLGFQPASAEGKVMGLSSYASPDAALMPHFRAMISDTGHVDPRWFDYPKGGDRYFSQAWIDTFGPARLPESPIRPHHQVIAACGQRRLEEVLFCLLRRLHRETGLSRLCLAGGVALNCVANGQIRSQTGFSDLFVQPAAHDAGTAYGAALAAHVRAGGQRPTAQNTVAFGPRFSDREIDMALRAAGLPITPTAHPDQTAAELIATGHVVGWFQGRAELGPRALGQRSILADPRDPGMPDRVNYRVKRREPFRPFAPAVLAEAAGEWFDGPPSPFMTTVHRVIRAGAPAITHVDGTARVQRVCRQSNERFHALIEHFNALTGVPMVLNTSFNLRGEPIVCRPAEAIADYLATDMDALVIGSRVVRKASRIAG